jgi:hypothetical protein
MSGAVPPVSAAVGGQLPSGHATADHAAVPLGFDAAALLRRVWIPIPIILILLDVTFGWYFWSIPKLTPRSADYGYQFVSDVHRLRQPAPGRAVRVVAVGSSVSGSFDPSQVERLLAGRLSVPVEVERLLLPGIKPSDVRLFFAAERAAMRADVAVIVVNLVDFLNPSFERDLKQQVRYVLPPWHTLRERWDYIPLSGRVDLVAAGVSNLYRYRKAIRSALKDHAKLVWRWARRGWSPYPPAVSGKIDTFLRFGDPTAPDFAARWDAELHGDSAFARRFRRYWELKVGLRDEAFEVDGEYAELERLVREFSEHGTEVVLVNSPESPWILREYGDGPYYRGYRAFFAALGRRYAGVSYTDLSDALPPQDFNDWHHVNYVGTEKLGSTYAALIEAAVSQRLARRPVEP